MSASLASRDQERWRQRRRESRDFSVPRSGPEKTARIDLGLTLLSLHALPGVRYSHDEIAAWCGCTESAIFLIEQRALRKLRDALQFRNRAVLAELRAEFFECRSPARRRITNESAFGRALVHQGRWAA